MIKMLNSQQLQDCASYVWIADLAANLRAKRGGKLPDTLIVATALNQESNCIYSQEKDLQRYIKDIKISELS